MLVRSGTASPEELRNLLHYVREEGVLDLTNEYSKAMRTPTSWWGYEVTITTNLRSRPSVPFRGRISAIISSGNSRTDHENSEISIMQGELPWS